MPRVSVLMSVRNGAPWLGEAMDGILGQSFTDFEFIILDDGSTDATPSILDGYADPRILRLHNPTSLGLTGSLNLGLRQAQGEFIARQDADDVSVPERLARQVAFLDGHPEVGLVGSAYRLIDGDGRQGAISRQPCPDVEIRWQMLFHNAFCHTSVMARRDLVENVGGYDEQLAYAQDYDLWARLLERMGGANLEEALVCLRLHGGSISSRRGQEQERIATAISRRQLEALLGAETPSLEALVPLRRCYYRFPETPSAADVTAATVFLRALRRFGAIHGADGAFVRRQQQNHVDRLFDAQRRRRGGMLPLAARLAVLAPGQVLRHLARRVVRGQGT